MSGKTKKDSIKKKISIKKRRLKLYYDREKEMLSPSGVQKYGIGSRNISRYETELADIRKQIKELEDEIEELEDKIEGYKPRKAIAVIPRDW